MKWYKEKTFVKTFIGIQVLGLLLIAGISIVDGTPSFFPGGWFNIFGLTVVPLLTYLLRNNA